MPDVKIDLTKLRQDIDARKNEINEKHVAMGKVPIGNGMPKGRNHQFLRELVTSMQTGTKTNATETIKTVVEAADAKSGVPRNFNSNRRPQQYVQENVMPVNQNPQPRSGASDWGFNGNNNGYGAGYGYNRGNGENERDNLFDQNFSRVNEEFDRQRMLGANPTAQKFVQQYGSAPQPQIVTTAQPLYEEQQVNIEKLVESNLKSVLTNIYTKEKIQDALSEYLISEDFVKVVARAINEIAKKNKTNQVKK